MGKYCVNTACRPRFMIIDACVLIDYMNGEPSLFNLISSHISPIYIASPVLEEIDSISSVEELENLGLVLIEPAIEDVFTAGKIKGPTSFQDNICFLTALRQGFTCVSNDKNLRKQCTNANVPVLWGLELLLELTRGGGIHRREASKIARAIQKSNPKHVTNKILTDFEDLLKQL